MASVPGASFQEQAVEAAIRKTFQGTGIKVRKDPSGNLVVRLGPRSSVKPPLVWVAHMDHPALVIQEMTNQKNVFFAKPMGDIPVDQLKGKSLPLFRLSKDKIITIGKAQVIKRQKGVVFLQTSANASAGDFCRAWPGKLQIGKTWVQGPAIDDLAGCAGIISALLALRKEKLRQPVIGLFTRAEEVGLVGATDVAKRRNLPKDALIYSVEMSHHLPGATPGKGAVIRLGDASGLFDPSMIDAMVSQARLVQGQIPLQAALMSGGVCEASSFRSFGYKTAGLACPLVGYHNRGIKSSVPEQIRVSDYLSLVAFIRVICTAPPLPSRALAYKKRLLERHKQYKKYF